MKPSYVRCIVLLHITPKDTLGETKGRNIFCGRFTTPQPLLNPGQVIAHTVDAANSLGRATPPHLLLVLNASCMSTNLRSTPRHKNAMASSPLAWSHVRSSPSRRLSVACASPQSSTAAAAPGEHTRHIKQKKMVSHRMTGVDVSISGELSDPCVYDTYRPVLSRYILT